MSTVDSNPLGRRSEIKWIPVGQIKVSPSAQRKFRPHRAEKIASGFDPDKLGTPVVSYRGGRYWVVDGQHRIAALNLMGYSDQLVQCQVYEGLSERSEAEMFDGLNDSTAVSALDKFLVRITAGRERECEIARVVQAEGIGIGRSSSEGIGCVGALGKVYDRGGPEILAKTIHILNESFGARGMRSEVVEGMGLVVHRYNGKVDEDAAIDKLRSLRGSFGALQAKATVIRKQVGRPSGECVAAAIVETLNAGRGRKKLPDWWSSE